MPLVLFFSAQDCYGHWCFWRSHVNFRILFHYFCEKCHWNCDEDCIDSVNCFGYWHFRSNTFSNAWTLYIFPFICVFCNFSFVCEAGELHWRHTARSLCIAYFWENVSLFYMPGLVDQDPPTYASLHGWGGRYAPPCPAVG